MSDDGLIVAPCSYRAAKYAVMHWHYSRTMPAPKHFLLGVWEESRYIGAVIFSRGANNNIGKTYDLSQLEVCELTRVALTHHQAFVSQIVAAALKALKAHNPGLRLVVSYADPNEGHRGGIYQAGNWIYTGQTSSDFAVLDAAGKRHHSRVVSKTGYTKQFGQYKRVIRPDEGIVIPLAGKHRYLYPLDKPMRKRVLPLALPYPKHE